MESAAVPVGSQATARTFDDDNSDDGGVMAAIIEVCCLLLLLPANKTSKTLSAKLLEKREERSSPLRFRGHRTLIFAAMR